MELIAKLTSGDVLNLQFTPGDREYIFSKIANHINTELLQKLDTNTLFDTFLSRISDSYMSLVKSEIDLRIKEVVNAFSSGVYPYVQFRSETIHVYEERIDAEEYVLKKFMSLGWNGIYSKTGNKSFQDLTNRIPNQVRLCLFEEDKVGMPDLFVYHNSSYAFIEVKTNNDCLRPDQMMWIKNHPNIIIIIFYLEQILHTKDEDDVVNYQLLKSPQKEEELVIRNV